MKTAKIWVMFIITIISLFILESFVLAQSKIDVNANKEGVNVGEEIEIEVKPEKSVSSFTLQIYFDMSKLEYINNVENSNFLENRVVYTWTGDEQIKKEAFTFKTLREGTASIIVTGEFYDKNGNKVDLEDGSIELQIGNSDEEQINQEEDSKVSTSNTDLKIMRLDKEGISPEFQKEIKQYYFVADNSINNLEVTAIPENSKSKITIKGNKNLKQGLNIITIQVRSEDNSKTSTYKINVTKTTNKELANANLENLAIRDIMLYPSFDGNITNYDVEVPNEIENLDILAVPEDINSKVVVTGKDGLKIGDNTIKITVTAQDKITKKVYEIKAHRRSNEEETEAQEEEKENIEKLVEILENEEKSRDEVQIENNKTNISNIVIIVLVFLAVIGTLIWYSIQKRKKQ